MSHICQDPDVTRVSDVRNCLTLNWQSFCEIHKIFNNELKNVCMKANSWDGRVCTTCIINANHRIDWSQSRTTLLVSMGSSFINRVNYHSRIKTSGLGACGDFEAWITRGRPGVWSRTFHRLYFLKGPQDPLGGTRQQSWDKDHPVGPA